jgi:ribosomal protein S18 acetylase RimI-like enzyme
MSTEQSLVRFATPADLDFVQQDHYVPADVVSRKIPWQEVVVAECEGRLAGYLRLEYLWSQIPYIALIRVMPQHQRRGVGKAMLRFVEEHLKGKGHRALYSSSQADEPEAQEWHRSIGFEECGVISGINKGGIGEIFFRKHL